MTIIHKETTSLVQAPALNSVVIYMLKDSEERYLASEAK